MDNGEGDACVPARAVRSWDETRSAPPGGCAVTLEFCPNDDRVSPPIPALFALTMLASTPSGDAYTVAELEKVFADAGFSSTEAYTVPSSGQSVLVSRV